MDKKNLNCWEFKKCGREQNGSNVLELGICPAVLDHSFDGTNGGMNGGLILQVLFVTTKSLVHTLKK